MPEEATPQEVVKDDPFDLGDSTFVPELDDPDYADTSKPESEPEKAEAPPAADAGSTAEPAASDAKPEQTERPRNADGTFAKKPPQHSPYLANLAGELGLSSDDLAAIPPSQLATTLQVIQRQQAVRSRQQPQQQQAPEISLGIDESQYDPDLLGVMKQQAAKLAQLEAANAEQQRQLVRAQLDAGFAKHGVLGTGRYADIKPGSIEMVRRQAVIAVAQGDTSGGTLQDKIDRAVAALFPSAPAKSEPVKPAEPTEVQKAWLNGATARPTQRGHGKEPKGEGRAAKAVAALMRERGLMDEDYDHEAGLPD